MPVEELSRALREKGWFISQDGMLACKEAVQNLALNQVILWLMDEDLKDVGDSALPGNLKKTSQLPSKVVLQVSRVRNIASPKAYQSDFGPRLLKIILTDGHVSVPALEFAHISALSVDTPPGTKILVRGSKVRISGGYILLEPSGIDLLGGVVNSLVNKAQNLPKYNRPDGTTDGAPPWIPFGQKLPTSIFQEKHFKSLEISRTDKVDKEFEAQRQATIAEVTKTQPSAKKVFGGGDKKLADHDTALLLEAGYPLDQVEKALKITGNNVDKALGKLQLWERKSAESKAENYERGGRGGRKGGSKQESEEMEHSRPSKPSTLFDFLPADLQTGKSADNSSKDKKSDHVSRDFSQMSIQEKSDNTYSRSTDKQRNYSKPGNYQQSNRGYQQQGRDYQQPYRDYRQQNRDHQQSNRDYQYQNREHQQSNRDYRQQNRDYQQSNGDYKQQNTRDYQQSNRDYQPQNKGYQQSNRDYQQQNKGYQQQNRDYPQHRGDYQQTNRTYQQQNRSHQEANKDYQPAAHKGHQQSERSYEQSNRSYQQSSSNKEHEYQQSSRSTNQSYNQNSYSSQPLDFSKPPPPIVRSVGDEVMARYWEDSKFYRAVITSVSSSGYMVHFIEYGNTEQVSPNDIYVQQASRGARPFSQDGSYHDEFSGTLEFRRGGGKPTYRKPR